MSDDTKPVEDAGLAALLKDVPAPPPDAKPKRNRPTTRAARAAAAGSKPRQPRATSTSTQVATSVKGLHELAGAVVAMTGRPVTGALLAESGPNAGAAWAELSKRYPAVARLFTGTSDAMVFVQLLMVYGPIISTAMSERRDPAAAAELGGLLSNLGPMMGGATPPDAPAADAA